MEEREGVPHHLLDFVDPQKEITIHEFHDLAVKTISGVLMRLCLNETHRRHLFARQIAHHRRRHPLLHPIADLGLAARHRNNDPRGGLAR